MNRSGRSVLTLVLSLFLLAEPSLGQTVIDVDSVFPSGGSGAPRVFSGGGQVEVALDTSDPGPVPRSVVDETGAGTPTATLTFTGMTQTPSLDGGFIYKPPDTHHAVGTGSGAAGRIVHVTNRGVQIFNKAGASVAGPLDLDAFLTALGAMGLSASGVANLGFDPKVIFDQHSGRFFIVILDGRTPGVRSNVHIVTSKTATPGTLTTTAWTVETASALTTFAGGDSWFDYPGIGADATRLVVTGNMFTAGGSGLGTKIRVFSKASLTDNGVPAGATFNDIDVDNSVTSGSFTAQPAHVFGSTLNGDFYLINRAGPTTYRLWQITGAGGAASLVAGSPSLHAWTAGAQLFTGAPQITDGFNDNPTIDTLSARIQNAVYRNDAGNADSIWLALAADSDSDARTEVVWFQIDPNSTNSAVAGTQTTPTIVQSGAIDGSTVNDWTYMPSISVNGAGEVVINYSESNSTKAVDHRVVARVAADAAGSFQSPVVIATGAGEYDDFNATNPERWGDYSATVVDPDDDLTFWVSNEIAQTAATGAGDDATWGTRIAQLGSVAGCNYSLSPMSGAAVSAGGTDSVIVIAPMGCMWTAVSNSPGLLTVTGGASGSGSGTVDYTVATNNSLTERSGTMTIAGNTFTVTQNAGFTTPTITVGATTIQAVHFNELRGRIDTLRADLMLSAFTWTGTLVAGSTAVLAVHVTEMRSALAAAYTAAMKMQPTYTDPGLAAGTVIKAVHITELRDAVEALELVVP